MNTTTYQQYYCAWTPVECGPSVQQPTSYNYEDDHEAYWSDLNLINRMITSTDEEEELHQSSVHCQSQGQMPLGAIENLPSRNRHKQSEAARLAKRNARERNRVLMVNKEFHRLRSLIKNSEFLRGQNMDSMFEDVDDECPPPRPARGELASRKLSKVNTLRMAIRYIKHLTQCLQDQDQVDFDLDLDDWDLTAESPMEFPTPTSSSDNSLNNASPCSHQFTNSYLSNQLEFTGSSSSSFNGGAAYQTWPHQVCNEPGFDGLELDHLDHYV